MDLNAAIEELYRVPPSEFVQTRRRLAETAQAEGDEPAAKRIRALRRPTVSAWAVNLLVREQGDLVKEMLELGEEIRRGWSAGEDPTRFDRVRNLAVAEAVRVAGALVEATGRPLGEQAAHEVEETLQAAIVDPGAAEEVRSGRLTHPRSHAGFAVPEAGPGEEAAGAREEGLRKRLERLEHRAAELVAERDALRREAEHVEEEAERLRHRLDQLNLHRSAVRRRLDDAEAQAETALARAAEVRSALGRP